MDRTASLAAVVALALALSVVGATGSAVAASQTQTVTVTVTVVDGFGNPVRDVDLHATWQGGSTDATTASNGKAFLDVPDGADVTVEVDHPAYTRNKPYQLTDASEGSVTIDVAQKSTITVTAADSEGPVGDAKVSVWQNGEVIANGETNNRGQFSTGVIEADEYRVTVLKPGYYQETATVDANGDTAHETTLERGTVTVTFRVLDRNFVPAKPVGGAAIAGDEIGSVMTQANGVQQTSVPVNSEVTVTVRKDGYVPIKKTISLEETDETVNISTRKKPVLSFDLLNDRVVVGEKVRIQVTDQYGNPMSDISVFMDGSQAGTTDAEGVVVLTVESAGQHTIKAESGELSTNEQTLTGVRPMAERSGSTPTTTSTPAAAQNSAPQPALSGVVSVPGAGGMFHLKSVGVGIGLGAALTIGLFVYRRLNAPRGGEA